MDDWSTRTRPETTSPSATIFSPVWTTMKLPGRSSETATRTSGVPGSPSADSHASSPSTDSMSRIALRVWFIV